MKILGFGTLDKDQWQFFSGTGSSNSSCSVLWSVMIMVDFRQKKQYTAYKRQTHKHEILQTNLEADCCAAVSSFTTEKGKQG